MTSSVGGKAQASEPSPSPAPRTSTTPRRRGVNFLTLPLEIRCMIYSLCSWPTLPLTASSAFTPTDLSAWTPPNALLGAHELVRRDVLHYWAQPAWTFTYHGWVGAGPSQVPACMRGVGALEVVDLEVCMKDGWKMFVAKVSFRGGREWPRVRIGEGTVLEPPERVSRIREVEKALGQSIEARRGYGIGAREMEALMRHLSDLRRARAMGR